MPPAARTCGRHRRRSTPSNNGFVGKQARFIGKAAHAGGAPHKGINALYAAQIALAAINAQRETFRDDDTVRIHPILTRGGDLVNVIPNDVRLETMVRGKTAAGHRGRRRCKVDRALRAGAVALGASVEITTLPGYMPLINERGHGRSVQGELPGVLRRGRLGGDRARTGSTDMGDHRAHHAGAASARRRLLRDRCTARDWPSKTTYLAYVLPAKLMAMTVIDLLADGASAARELLADYTPPMTKDEYLAFMRRCNRRETFDGAML